MLLKAGADKNVASKNGRTPLATAVELGFTDCKKLLLLDDDNNDTVLPLR
jgi:hypothetical protein